MGDRQARGVTPTRNWFCLEAQTPELSPPVDRDLGFTTLLYFTFTSHPSSPLLSSPDSILVLLDVPASPVADVRLIARIRRRKVKGKDLPHPRNRHLLAFNHRTLPP